MKKKTVAFGVSLLMTAVLLAGCGSGGNSAESSAAVATEEGSYDTAEGTADYGEYEEVASEETSDDGSSAEAVEGQADKDASEQKIVYSSSLTIQTLDYDEAYQSIKDLISQYNAILEDESFYDGDTTWYYEAIESSGGTRTSYITVRVPAESYEDFLTSLEGSGKVTEKSQDALNITTVYNDQTALIESLETQEARLQEMMDAAETIEDMVTVESRLTEVQTELNQARTRLDSMDTDVNYSTVSITLEEVREYEEEKTTPLTLGEHVIRSWQVFADAMQGLLKTLIYLLPFLILAGGITAVVLVIVKLAKKPKDKKNEKDEKGSEQHD